MSEQVTVGSRAYQEFWAKRMEDPEFRRIYEEESLITDLWLALADARYAAGLTQAQLAERMGVSQAQVARIEKRGYDAYTLKTLRRYVKALGDGFSLEIKIQVPNELKQRLLEPNPAVVITELPSAAEVPV